MRGGVEMAVTSVLPVAATLGEGPVWNDGRLWFVDIKASRVHSYCPDDGSSQQWNAPDQIGWVLPSARGDMIAGVRTGLHRFDHATGQFSLLHDPEPGLPGNRLNDAATDQSGRLWFGSMDDGETLITGRLYRCEAGACRDTGLPPVVITNGPAIRGDGQILYHTDTLGKTIWRVPIGADGTLGEPVRHIVIEDAAGYPDGSVIDAEGCLWVALFGGWGVRRYDPSGKLMHVERFPVANVTKIAFGGDNLATAYATTARKGLDRNALAAQPLAGNLFAFDPGVTGLPVVPARI